MKQPVVLDKSYLQGTSRADVQRLSDTHRLLMSEALLYELLSNPLDRKACFAKLPPVDNPVDLVTHVGGYLLKEVNTRRPSPKPSERTHRLRFQFKPLMLTDTYELPVDAADEVARQHKILLSDALPRWIAPQFSRLMREAPSAVSASACVRRFGQASPS